MKERRSHKALTFAAAPAKAFVWQRFTVVLDYISKRVKEAKKVVESFKKLVSLTKIFKSYFVAISFYRSLIFYDIVLVKSTELEEG